MRYIVIVEKVNSIVLVEISVSGSHDELKMGGLKKIYVCTVCTLERKILNRVRVPPIWQQT